RPVRRQAAPPKRKRPAPARKKPAPRPAPRQVEAGLVNAAALAPFFDELRQLQAGTGTGPVRVLHFGDSHTAADMWTGRIRERLQARFGDGGPGLVLPGGPWRGYPHAGMKFLTGRKWEALSVRSPLCDGWVGLTGACIVPPGGETFWLRAAFADFRLQTLEEAPQEAPACLLGSDASAVPDGATVPASGPRPLSLQVGAEAPLADGRLLRIRGPEAPLPLASRELGLALSPNVRVLGIELLSGRPGIVYDELGLNGAELLDLERWTPRIRQALLADARAGLLVLAYGTNEAGHASLDPQEYQTRAIALLDELRRESGAPILLVGPPDRSARAKRSRVGLAAQESAIIRALKSAAQETGCAFWDMRQAMGGPGTMLKWRRAGLAQPDLVHLTGPGYQRLADLLVDALLDGSRRQTGP
ncbi:MAG TPA: GDSL-type esterase/lipase family protein, partial [Holophaga sp.]|nr:GDSL-type esterase/lipase family protein [Holophaga sp.]